MLSNASFAGEVLADYAVGFDGDESAAAELRDESSWNTSNASSLGGLLDARRARAVKTRSTQVETQQSVQQEGL